MEEKVVVPVGRDFGFYGEENGTKYFAVGSVVNKVILPHIEYYCWKMLRKYKTLDEWKENLQAKINTKFKNLDIHEILLKFVANNLILLWDFSDPTDEVLQNAYIIRNGLPVNKANNTLRLNGPFKEDELTLTQRQYVLWNSAAGYASIIDTLAQAMDDLNIEDDQEILSILMKDGINLVKVGLWDIDILVLNGAEKHDE